MAKGALHIVSNPSVVMRVPIKTAAGGGSLLLLSVQQAATGEELPPNAEAVGGNATQSKYKLCNSRSYGQYWD